MTGLVPERTIGEREITLLLIAVSIHGEHFVLVAESSFAGQYRGQHRSDGIPYLRPHFRGCSAHRGRMFVAEHRHVGVVVNLHQPRSPEDHYGEPGRQADADGCPQSLWPGPRGADRCHGPVQVTHQCPGGAAGVEHLGQICWDRSRRRCGHGRFGAPGRGRLAAVVLRALVLRAYRIRTAGACAGGALGDDVRILLDGA